MVKETVGENRFGPMAMYMKGTGKMIKFKGNLLN